MSPAPPDISVTEAGISPGAGGHQYPLQSTQTQPSQGVPNFVDGSGPIFSMYLEMAAEEDKKKAESWKADADGILIFTGLFSAAVASLISVSIQDIRPNSQDTSNFYLANIYQTIADPDRRNIPLPSSPPTFSPPKHAVWVNALWFLSLVISLTCALLATLLQQWARRYLKATQPRYGPHKRARIRAFFFEGAERFLLPWVTEGLPTLLHVSLFLFFSGLVVFLCNDNLTIFKLVLSWVGICTVLYGCITVMPLFRHECPYYIYPAYIIGVAHCYWDIICCLSVFWRLTGHYHKIFLQGMQRTAEDTALYSPSEIDTRAFMWTFDSLDEDHELERFFHGLPGFRSSKVVDDPLPRLTEEQKRRLFQGMIRFLDRTSSSDLLPDYVKSRRVIICMKALDPAKGAYRHILFSILSKDQYRALQTAEIARVVRGRGDGGHEDTALFAQATVSCIVARAQFRDDSWFILASSELGVPEDTLRDYSVHTLSLAILIHITRQQFSHVRKLSWPSYEFSTVLEAASKSNLQDASVELQHDFCALWNEIVLKAQNDNDRWIASDILKHIRRAYITLHQDTNSALTQFSASTSDHDTLSEPSSYPVCKVASHVREDSASTTFSRFVLHDNAAMVPASLARPDAHSSSVSVPLHIDEGLTAVPPLADDIYVPGSFYPTHHTAIENPHIPATSLSLVTTPATHGSIGTSAKMKHLSAPDPSASNPPESKASIPPPDTVVVPQTADRCTPSDYSDVPSSPSPTPVPENMLPPGPHLSSDSPVTGYDHASSSPEPHSPLVTVTPDPWPLSVPDLGAATDGEGSAGAELHKKRDAHNPPSTIWENVMAAPDLPLQSPSPPSVPDVATASPSRCSLGIEHTEDRPPHPSHG